MTKQFEEILTKFNQVTMSLEEAYVESEGEVTEQTELMEAYKADMEIMLQGGLDDFAGLLKAKEDRKKAIKAEIDFLKRKVEAIDRSIDFYKGLVRCAMVALGTDKVKGERGYSFTTYTSHKTEIDKDYLNERYAAIVEDAVRDIVPEYVKVNLTASYTKAEEVGMVPEDYNIFAVTETDTVRFAKPRASKEA